MLRSMEDLKGYAIGATDGVVGHVKDFYFDDEAWTVRYFVVDTGGWLENRRVLISPFAVGKPTSQRVLPVSLTREKVKDSPDIDTDKPVSRQHEIDYLGYYGYPLYWGGIGYWGAGLYPGAMLSPWGYGGAPGTTSDPAAASADAKPEQHADSHLRSCRTVKGYHVHASDGDIGHVDGMLIDDETWAIRYLIVNTSNWWVGHKVLVAPQWIGSVRWSDASVSVDLTREAVRSSPSYLPTAPLDREQETGLYEHYGRDSYWADGLKRETELSRI